MTTAVMEQCGQQPLSPPMSLHSDNLQPPISDENQQLFAGDDTICDDCQMPKRYATMAWWWDKQCVMNICEHCGVLKHRNHDLLLHSEAERRANDDYNNFLETTRSQLTEKLADFNKQKEFLDSVDSTMNDVDRFRNGKEKLIERFDTTMQEIENELLILGDARLNHAVYKARQDKRKSMNGVIDAVRTMLLVLQPRLKNLLALFNELKVSSVSLSNFQSADGRMIDEEEECQEEQYAK